MDCQPEAATTLKPFASPAQCSIAVSNACQKCHGGHQAAFSTPASAVLRVWRVQICPRSTGPAATAEPEDDLVLGLTYTALDKPGHSS